MIRNPTSQFVRGGQTTQHWWRMGLQVLRFSMAVGVGVFVLSYGALVLRGYEINRAQMAYAWWIAELTVINKADPDQPMKSRMPDGSWWQATAGEIHRSPEHRDIYALYQANAVRYLWFSLPPSLAAMALSMAVFWWTGQKLSRDTHVRGSRLVSPKELKRWSGAKWREHDRAFGASGGRAQRTTIAGIPFPPNTIEAQTGIFGTTGVGKTTAIKELIANIRAGGGRAFVYDRMGGMVRDFYDPRTDIIVNPFDARSHVWTPFLEAETPAAIAQIAEVLVPERPDEREPFWTQTARLVFEHVARQLLKQGKRTNADLRQAIMDLPPSKLEELLAATPGRHFFGKHIEKTSASIRANMITQLRFFEFLRDDGPAFSARDWVKRGSGPGIVFLTGDAEHTAATRNVISAIIEVAANALMTCEEAHEPRIWFIIDELPSLNSMPFMISKIAQVRQFGGAFVLGYQVYAQLEAVYGEKGARSISGNLNNRIVFNTPDAQTAKIFSESLGSEDLVEIRQNVMVGAHAARDGQGMSENRVERPLVTASQIQAMPQFRAYVRFAYDAPTALIEMRPRPEDDSAGAPAFLRYGGSGFATGTMDVARDTSARGFADLPPDARLAEFETWFARIAEPVTGTDSLARPRYSDADRPHLWAHYAGTRMAGHSPDGIGPPEPGAELAGAARGTGPAAGALPPDHQGLLFLRDRETRPDGETRGGSHGHRPARATGSDQHRQMSLPFGAGQSVPMTGGPLGPLEDAALDDGA